jgi:hypothetical protein
MAWEKKAAFSMISIIRLKSIAAGQRNFLHLRQKENIIAQKEKLDANGNGEKLNSEW